MSEPELLKIAEHLISESNKAEISSTRGDLYDTDEAARRLNVSKSYLNKARVYGAGPPYLKLGKSVRYHWPTVMKWLEAQTRRSTSETREVA